MNDNSDVFNGKLGKYKILSTEDNTLTVYSEYFDEACHNLSGAYAETYHNYILGCKIPESFNQNKNFSVLDVGFGVGVGLKALLDELDKHPHFNSMLSYYSIELDEEFFLWSAKETLSDLKFNRKTSQDLVYFECTTPFCEMKIFIGDGRLTLPKAHELGLIQSPVAIFQDAFSPKKNPTLWSVEWFIFLKTLSLDSVVLSTYSSSISIRKSLLQAGWTIENAKGFALKRTMTKAYLSGETSPLILDQLKRSPSLAIEDKTN